ncbi:transmembrane protein 169 [Neocloeon triangulifer]|uniref:transmembrane protein 169 n=1 Tax=Neocloeon triangulifer TaxID=2078957 RepID=UPI00286EFD77|nr:transmembrane protein 169 [Neocloeon triangulifer]
MAEKRPTNFQPPVKRTSGKKTAGGNAHGDYIMTVQGHGRSPVTSPSEEDLEKIDRISEVEPMVSRSSATPDSQLIESISTDQSRSPSLDLMGSNRRKKKVNICTENSNDPLVGKVATSSSSLDRSESDLTRRSPSENFLTLTGTIKRGRKAGQNVDVKLNMSREELEIIEAAIMEKNPKENPCFGIHIFIFSVFCIPFITVAAIVYNFYMGTLTWYNIFTHFSNGYSKIFCSKIIFPPFIILLYPIFIVSASLLLGLYAGVVQVSFDLIRWKTQVQDLEKGFFGSMCSALKLEDCSPYEVVILMDIRQDNSGRNSQPEA